jgi:hypothetical protein
MPVRFAAILCLLLAFGPLRAQPGASFPAVTSERLDKARARLPQDFAGKVNILTVFFRRDQNDEAASWTPAILKLEAAHPDVKSYTLPVFGRENILSRWWTNASMRSTIKPQQWSTTIPLYVKRSEFMATLRLASDKQPTVLLTDHQGKVLWQTQGAATPTGVAALQTAVSAALR